jgi:hypothetical protein
VLTTILTAASLLAQCNFTSVASDQFRSSVLDLAVDGNDLWAATSYGIALYDRNLTPPRLMTSVAIPGTTRLVRVSNGLGYVGSGSALVIVRKNGRALQVVRSIDVGAPINDLVLTTLSLYIATRNGIAQYDLVDPTNPLKTSATFQTSQRGVLSLALMDPLLFAADGDASVEVFNITTTQRTGSVDVPPSAIAVHTNDNRLYVSSPIKTAIFQGQTNIGEIAGSMTSFARISGEAAFIGSTDRTLRGVDLTLPGTPIDIFREELPPTSGTMNRVFALATAPGRLYVGAGDIGLLTYDISGFSDPFPMRGYSLPNVSSIVSLGDRFYVGRTNGVTEVSRTLVQGRSWDGGRSDIAHDADNNLLLTSSGSSMTLWSLSGQVPAATGMANFRAAVRNAVLIGTTAYAVLADRTLWSTNLSQFSAAPQPIALTGIRPLSIARSASSIAISDTRDDGTTLVAYFATPDFSGAPKTVSVPGLATTGVTLSNGIAAVQTFRGISLIDFSSGTAAVLPQSNTEIARQLFLTGPTLLQLTDSTLKVWNTQAQSVSGEITLPSTPLAIHVAPQSRMADIATSSGVVTVALDRIAAMPSLKPASNGNAYYKKVAASSSRMYLFDQRGIDIYSSAMRYTGSIRAQGVIDVAASESGVFTLSSNLTVSAYSPEGYAPLTASISEGADAQALGITTVNGAVWVSIVRGCSTGGCEKKTIVFDLRLNQTASMSGGVLDVVTSAGRAYAITDLPAEVRIINVADPLHPAVINSRAAEAAPVSIAYSNGTLYVLGNTLAAYSETSLTKIGDILGAYSSDGTVTYPDQRVRIDGNCAVVTGRSFGPTLYSVGPQWSAQSSPSSPSAARAIAIKPGTMYILTDHSLEIWSTSPQPKPARRRVGAGS